MTSPRAPRLLSAWNLLVIAGWASGPFLAAGDARWGRGWAHLALLAACLAGHRAFVGRRNPELLRRRRRIGPGTVRWDLRWNAAFWPLIASIAAAAAAANPFFEGTVRIQREVGQRPVDAGPYARIRHPRYADLALWALGTPLFLGSPLAIPPALATVAWVALRTALEDRLLRRELPGYQAYAARVRWRLLPGLW